MADNGYDKRQWIPDNGEWEIIRYHIQHTMGNSNDRQRKSGWNEASMPCGHPPPTPISNPSRWNED